MLMTVLKGELATKQSKALVRTFKKMKDYIIGNQALIGQRAVMQLSIQISKNTDEINKLHMDIGFVERQMSDVCFFTINLYKKITAYETFTI